MSSYPGGERSRNSSLPRYRTSDNTEKNAKDPFANNPSDNPRSKERFHHFPDDSRQSGEDILRHLKDQLRRESDMFFQPHPEWDNDSLLKRADEEADDWARRGFDDMRSRHPMFRMPNWMSEEDDVSNLASRMSQTPHWPQLGRRGRTWRERRNSGGSGISGASEEDAVDRASQCSGGSNRSETTMHSIPIRIEAEAPPGYEPSSSPQVKETKIENNPPQAKLPEGIEPHMSIGNQPQYASKTTSSVESTGQEEVPRDTRSSSAPPDMANQGQANPQRFVSKINITPQTNSEQNTKKFNNVAKPFSSSPQDKQSTIAEEQTEDPQKQNPPPPPQPQQAPHPQMSQPRDYQQQFPHSEPQQDQHQHYQQPNPQQQFHGSAPNWQQPPHQPQYQQPHSYFQGDPQLQHPQAHFQQTQTQSHPAHQSPPQNQRGGVVRNIPIFVEGRDAPFSNMGRSPPSKSPPNVTGHHFPQQNQKWQQQHQQQAPPQQHPFMNPAGFQQSSHGFPQGQHSNFRPMPEQFFRFPNEQQHQQQQPPKFQNQFNQHPPAPGPQPQHQRQEARQQQIPVETPQQAEPTQPQPKPQPPIDTKMNKIDEVRALLSDYQTKVENFQGQTKTKEYLYLDEMLTRALLQLDNIDPDGRDDIRQARRSLVKDINNTIAALEKKVSEASEGKMEVDDQIPSEILDKDDTRTSKDEPQVDVQNQSETAVNNVQNTNKDATEAQQNGNEKADQTSKLDESQSKSENDVNTNEKSEAKESS